MVLAEAVVWAPVAERVQVLRGGQARAYVIAEEHEDGSLLLAPEPVPSAQDDGTRRRRPSRRRRRVLR